MSTPSTPDKSSSAIANPTDATKQIAELTAKLKALALKYTQDKKQWDDTQAHLDEKTKELSLAGTLGKALLEENNQLKHQLLQLSEEKDRIENAMQVKMRALEQFMQQHMASEQHATSSTSREVATLKDQIESLQVEKQQLIRSLSEMTAKCHESERIRLEVFEDLQDAQKSSQISQTELNTMRRKNEELREQVEIQKESLLQSTSSTDDLRKQIAELKSKNVRLVSQVEIVEEKSNELEQLKAENKQLRQRVLDRTQLEQQLESLKRDNEQMRDLLSDKEEMAEMVEDLIQQNKQYRQQLEDTQSLLLETTALANELRQRLQEQNEQTAMMTPISSLASEMFQSPLPETPITPMATPAKQPEKAPEKPAETPRTRVRSVRLTEKLPSMMRSSVDHDAHPLQLTEDDHDRLSETKMDQFRDRAKTYKSNKELLSNLDGKINSATAALQNLQNQFAQSNTSADLLNSLQKLKVADAPSGPRNETNIKEGWLLKQGHFFRTWRRRYHLLMVINNDARLFYAETKQANFKGVILLRDAVIERIERDDFKRQGLTWVFGIKTTYNKVFLLAAASKEELDEWINLLQRTIDETKLLSTA